ncbi:MAG: hypothetical protein PF517_06175 [Salinivirgaceae bacterium]|nr:hypothetical protein [Salinivirgaceae bacterium]
MFEEQFSNCPLKFVLEDNEFFINYAPDDSIMVVDFLKGLDEKRSKRLFGAIMMQVMVDTIDNVCCVSYTNESTLSNRRLDVPNRLLAMQGWSRLPNCNKNENICALVSIVFDKKEFSVIRTGYNRNTGGEIIQSVTYKRYPEESTEILEN